MSSRFFLCVDYFLLNLTVASGSMSNNKNWRSILLSMLRIPFESSDALNAFSSRVNLSRSKSIQRKPYIANIIMNNILWYSKYHSYKTHLFRLMWYTTFGYLGLPFFRIFPDLFYLWGRPGSRALFEAHVSYTKSHSISLSSWLFTILFCHTA